MSAAEQPIGEQSICIGCGLCCDGTLHPHTLVEADDEETVLAANLSIVEKNGERSFAQPCPKFSGRICTIYDRRPGACRRYRCKLLKNVEEDRVSVADARVRIATAKSLIAAACTDSAESATATGRIALAKRLQGTPLEMLDKDERQQAARTLLSLSAVDYFLERWFLFKKSDRPEQPQPIHD